MRHLHIWIAVLGVGLAVVGPAPVSAGPDDPAAWVNGTIIRNKDLSQAVVARKRELSGRGIAPGRLRKADMPQAVLNGLILRELALQECRRQGIFISSSDINARIRAIVSRLGSRQKLNTLLKEADLPQARLRAMVEGDLAIARLLETTVVPKVIVSEDDIRDFYERYPHIFRTPEMVRARHILVALPENPAEDEVAEARYEIEDLRRRIGREDDFTGIAIKYSQDKTTANLGGDLGFFARAEMVKSFGDAAFTQEPGQIGDPIRTGYGFHVIQVTDRRPAARMPLDSVAEVIREVVRRQHIDQAARVYLERLKAGADIRIH